MTLLVSGGKIVKVGGGYPSIAGGGGGGSLTHGASATFTGTGFGSKATAAPQVWDDCSHGQSIGSRWVLAWPNASPSTENMDYRAAQRGIALPHANITKYMCGCANGAGNNTGANIMVWHDLGVITLPFRVYVSYYFRGDDAWNFNGTNLKVFDYTNGTGGGYDLPNNWYEEYRDPPTSNAASSHPTWHCNDDTASLSGSTRTGSFLVDPDTNNSIWYGNPGINPFAGAWVKVEYVLQADATSSGKWRVYQNNVNVHQYDQYTDQFSQAGGRAIGIGGYTDMRDPNNFQYFSDLYVDHTWARLVLGNAATYAACSIVEPQPPTAWSGSSIDVTINKGALSSGIVYPYVFADGSETPIALASRTMN